MATKNKKLWSLPAPTLLRQRRTMSAADMAKAHRVSVDTIYQLLRHHGIKGVAAGSAKFNISQVRQIREIYAKTRNAAAIARKYGVRPSTIRDIVNGITWKWVK